MVSLREMGGEYKYRTCTCDWWGGERLGIVPGEEKDNHNTSAVRNRA